MQSQSQTSQSNPLNLVKRAPVDHGQAFKVTSLAPRFLDFARFEDDKRQSSVDKYHDCLRNFVRRVGDVDVRDIDSDLLILLRKRLRQEGIGHRREASIFNTLRIFVKFCAERIGLEVISYLAIRPPRIPKRIPEYLTDEELREFIAAIKMRNLDKTTNIAGLRFRLLVEIILATGARISETLSIKVADINFADKEVKIIGKGNKERELYLTERCILWIREYLAKRQSDNEFLFVTRDGTRQLKVHDLWRFFKRYKETVGLKKKVSAHTFRRTFATKLRDNGVDITIVSELLGHADINTTARYYIGTNRKQNKAAHQQFLRYDI